VPPTLSIVLKARNEEAMIPGWLRRLDFADEIVAAVDDRSDDRTAELLVSAGVKVTTVRFEGFDALVNAAIDLATGDWVFLLDADERVSRLLAAEIRTAVDGPFDGLRVPTANYFHAQLMRFGGWQEHPVKLWRRGTARLAGTIHERACFLIENPRIGELQTPLAHLSHRSVIDNLTKSANYVEVQASALHAGGAPPVTRWSLCRTLIREIGFRLVLRRGWKDGVVGVYEACYWPLSNLCAQARLWELQQEPSIDDQYARLEDTTW
jgi:glycosyltransferase involved in cell wall biosynthesis